MALQTVPIDASFFATRPDTAVTWLGMAGVLVNSRGTIILIDPLLTYGETREVCETGDRLLVPYPITSHEVPRADIVCYTHADFDHFAKDTASILNERLAPRFLAPPPVAKELRELGVSDGRLTVAEDFQVVPEGGVEITVTPALHDYPQEVPWKRGDCCGFVMTTPDGVVWHPGDTRLIPELEAYHGVDVFFFDVAAVDAHLGPEGSAHLARTSGAKVMIAYHYGTFDVPAGSFGGCDPEDARAYLTGLDAAYLQPSPGEIITLPLR